MVISLLCRTLTLKCFKIDCLKQSNSYWAWLISVSNKSIKHPVGGEHVFECVCVHWFRAVQPWWDTLEGWKAGRPSIRIPIQGGLMCSSWKQLDCFEGEVFAASQGGEIFWKSPVKKKKKSAWRSKISSAINPLPPVRACFCHSVVKRRHHFSHCDHMPLFSMHHPIRGNLNSCLSPPPPAICSNK